MFNKVELQFLMACVDSKSSENTQVARNKGYMMMKLSDQIDELEKAEAAFAAAPMKEPEEKEPEEKAKPKKK